MAIYREHLPLISDDIFITDGGLETTLIFQEHFELPQFAAFVLLDQEEGRRALVQYFRQYAAIACEHGLGLVLESPTWRASPKWGNILGYSRASLTRLNHDAIKLLVEIRDAFENDKTRMVISGCIGPKGSGYVIDERMSVEQAEEYHLYQIKTLSETEADLVSAYTLTHAEEAIGIALAARSVNMPVAIGFTVETDGKLPSGQTIQDAITLVDAATGAYPAYYMINCAHPTHFNQALHHQGAWKSRIRAVRANASTMSHAELDEAEQLDDGNPEDLGHHYQELRGLLANLNILGGCCGTDHRHVEAICKAVRG